MNIHFDPIESNENALEAVEEKKAEIASSKWHKIANGEMGANRVDEGKRMIARLNNELAQLVDSASNKPAEPRQYMRVYDAYDIKDELKKMGFRWDGGDKSWGRYINPAKMDRAIAKVESLVK